MTADVIETAQLALGAAHQQQRFAQKFGGEKVARLGQLLAPSDHLPGAGKDSLVFARADFWVGIERRRNGPGPRNVGIDLKCRKLAHRRCPSQLFYGMPGLSTPSEFQLHGACKTLVDGTKISAELNSL